MKRSILSSLELVFGRFAIPHVAVYIIFGQVVLYIFGQTNPALIEAAKLIPDRILEGELYRILSFLAVPPATNLVFAFFGWYLFWLMAGALENFWGVFRFNLFLFVGYVATVAVSFLTPHLPASTAFLGGSVFLAFAWLNPEFTLMLFFVLPVKIKWLARLTWAGYFLTAVFGSWQSRLLVLASIANFFLFFGREVWLGIRYANRAMTRSAKDVIAEHRAFHTCEACGRTDKSHPREEFRYCQDCIPMACYCSEHLATHKCRKSGTGPAE